MFYQPKSNKFNGVKTRRYFAKEVVIRDWARSHDLLRFVIYA